MISELFKQADIRWDKDMRFCNALCFCIVFCVLLACILYGCAPKCKPYCIFTYYNGKIDKQFITYEQALKIYLKSDAIEKFEMVWCDSNKTKVSQKKY